MNARKIKFDEVDLLTKFERDTLCAPYRDFYVAKRNNLFASIDGLKDLWGCFMLANAVWMREFEDMRSVRETGRMFPPMLFMNGHLKMLIAMELAFSSCLTEAYSILRDAIESVAHGHRLFSDPALQVIWFEKNAGATSSEDFNREFWHSKESKLFDGLPELFNLWKRYSEIGAHTNISSIVSRFEIQEDSAAVTWKVNYTGVGEIRLLVTALFEMLLIFSVMERVFFKDCESRLQLDPELIQMRAKFQRDKEQLRSKIIRAFNIRPPVGNP